MAQLSDDCFAFGGPLLSVEAAQALIAERIPSIAGEEVLPLGAALGRVLAGPLHAPGPLPPFFNAAVDGWAFRHADLATGGDTSLPVSGRVQAGQAAAALPAGHASRIFTGAPMPDGADTVMMQEDAREAPGAVIILPGLKRGANCRPAGEDVAAGALALPAGRRLTPPDIGLAAALGLASLAVRPRLRVGVFSTGDELAEPGGPLGPAQTYDSNRFTLLALLARLPVLPCDLGILPDDPAATAAALAAAAATHDLLLTSGGVSTGEADHVKTAIEQGGRLVFWRLAIKPGRPAAMGLIGQTPVIGLPGNPVAAVVTFLHLARPLLLKRAGALPEPLPRFQAEADFAYRKKAGRREYVRVTLRAGSALPIASKYPREGAGLLSSLVQSDAFAELPEEITAVRPGDRVAVLPFAAVL
jgi:molybdopterin molybdotransferase